MGTIVCIRIPNIKQFIHSIRRAVLGVTSPPAGQAAFMQTKRKGHEVTITMRICSN